MKKLSVIFIFFLLCLLDTTSMAADWKNYGGSQLATFFFTYNFSNVETQSDDHMGPFGYSFIDNNSDQTQWAEYGLGDVKMGFGRNHSTVHAWVSNQFYGSEMGLLDVGEDDKQDMMRFIWGGFNLSLIKTNIGGDGGAATVDSHIPKIEAHYNLSFSHGHLTFLGGLNTYTLEDASGDESGKITSWIYGLSGFYNLDSMYFNWDAFYTQNYSDYGLPSMVGQTHSGAKINANLNTDDTNSIGGISAFGINLNDTMIFELGIGYRQDNNPELLDGFDPTLNVYGQLPITLINGFYLTPEIGYYNFMEDGNGGNEGDLLYVGAKWQMNF